MDVGIRAGTFRGPAPVGLPAVARLARGIHADRPGRRPASGRTALGAPGRRADRREAGRRAPGARRQDPRRVAVRHHRPVDRAFLLLGRSGPRHDPLRLDLPGVAPDGRVRLGIGRPSAGAPPGRGGQRSAAPARRAPGPSAARADPHPQRAASSTPRPRGSGRRGTFTSTTAASPRSTRPARPPARPRRSWRPAAGPSCRASSTCTATCRAGRRPSTWPRA